LLKEEQELARQESAKEREVEKLGLKQKVKLKLMQIERYCKLNSMLFVKQATIRADQDKVAADRVVQQAKIDSDCALQQEKIDLELRKLELELTKKKLEANMKAEIGELENQGGSLLGHYSVLLRPRVADRGTPSRTAKRVASDKEDVADKQCIGEGKL